MREKAREAFLESWGNALKESREKEREWIDDLRAQGFKAAHPYDGWVDRADKVLTFSYPQFNDGAGIGDKVMLGRPPSGIGRNLPQQPVVLREKIESHFGLVKWRFDHVKS